MKKTKLTAKSKSTGKRKATAKKAVAKKTTAKRSGAKKSSTKKSATKAKSISSATSATGRIEKSKLIARIAKKANISTSKATAAYECVLLETPAWKKQAVKSVKVLEQKAVAVRGKTTVQKVELNSEKAVKTTNSVEKIKVVEVIKEVPVEVIKKVVTVKIVEVIKEVPVKVIVEKIKQIEVIKEVPVEIIKEVTLVREVEVVAKVEVIKKVVDDKAIDAWKKKYAALEKDYKDAKKQLSAKPKVITKIVTKEIIKEVPIEIIKEVEVVKSIDMDVLKKMMTKMATVQVSRKVTGETRTAKDAKVVSRREIKEGDVRTVVKSSSKKSSSKDKGKKSSDKKSSSKKDDLTKVEGIGPKIEQLLNAANIHTWTKLAKTKSSIISKILSKAGPRFQMHDPATWPKQADMAANGKWDKLKKWQDEHSGGRK